MGASVLGVVDRRSDHAEARRGRWQKGEDGLGSGASSEVCGSTRSSGDSRPAHHDRGGSEISTGGPLTGFGRGRPNPSASSGQVLPLSLERVKNGRASEDRKTSGSDCPEDRSRIPVADGGVLRQAQDRFCLSPWRG